MGARAAAFETDARAACCRTRAGGGRSPGNAATASTAADMRAALRDGAHRFRTMRRV